MQPCGGAEITRREAEFHGTPTRNPSAANLESGTTWLLTQLRRNSQVRQLALKQFVVKV
jgi:hypothetical protein